MKHIMNTRLLNRLPHMHAPQPSTHRNWTTRKSLTSHDENKYFRLNSGHCHKLVAYHNINDPTVDRPSQKCHQSSHSLEQWLQTCPATQQQRLQILGRADRPLDMLTTDPLQVMLYAPWETPLVTRDVSLSSSSSGYIRLNVCQRM